MAPFKHGARGEAELSLAPTTSLEGDDQPKNEDEKIDVSEIHAKGTG